MVKRFLVTTALEETWPDDGPVLFLGEWCRLYSRKNRWSVMDAEVLPYHWDDRSRLHADYEYIRGLSQRCLSGLVPILNGFHQINRSYRFWNIFLGAWLRDFVGICFDRYLSIRAAADSGKVDMVLLPTLNHLISPSAENAVYRPHYTSPQFNNYLYGYIIRNMEPFPFREIPLGKASLTYDTPDNKRHWSKTLAARIWELIYRLAPESFKQIALVNSYLTGTDLFRISMRLRQLPALDAAGGGGDQCGRDDEGGRGKLQFFVGDGEFERLLSKLLPLHLPRAAFEGFGSLQARVEWAFPKSTKVIFATNLCGGSDILKMWAAKQTEAGGRLLLHQHGGNYGTALYSAIEDFETEIADKFYSWGWTKKGMDKVQPLSSAKLIGTVRRFKVRKAGGILVSCDAVPLYFYRFASMPIAHQMTQFHDDYVRFFRGLAAPVYKLSLLRLYPMDHGWGEAAFYRSALPGLCVYQGSKSFYRQLNRSRLFVCGNNQTSYLETMAAGFPTIVFLNPGLWEIRAEAQPYFHELEQVGICHFSPESAAAFVNQVASDPLAWWQRADVQVARKHFCDRFAYINDHWIKLWKEELTSCLKSSREAGSNAAGVIAGKEGIHCSSKI